MVDFIIIIIIGVRRIIIWFLEIVMVIGRIYNIVNKFLFSFIELH